MFKKILPLLIFIFITFLSGSLFATKTYALISAQDLANIAKLIDAPKEFCDKRSGDLMNLETWYSGKCSKETFTLSDEGVGFSDIVILQGIEYLTGQQTEGFIDKLKSLVTPLSQNPSSQNIATNQTDTGLIGSLSKGVYILTTAKPATTAEYIAYLTQNLHYHNAITQVYAANPGYGFTALSPLIKIWQAFRNISYVLFALAFVIYGLMITLRIRVDAKTTASIQLAFPKLITTLLLITFSYAIVGLIIDLSTVASALLINILKLGGILSNTPNSFGEFNVQASGGTFGALVSFLRNLSASTIVAPWVIFNSLIGAGGNIIVTAIGGFAVMFFFGWIISIVLLIAVAYSYFKLILKLFESFISIVISLIFSPIILLGNILPGSNAFSSWIMGIIANASVFPITSFLLVLSYALMVQPIFDIFSLIPGLTSFASDFLGVANLTTTGGTIWTPPMTLSSNSSASLMLGAIGIGLLLMASKYVDMVKDALKVPPFKYGSAIGEVLKTGFKNRESVAKPLSAFGAPGIDSQRTRADKLQTGLESVGVKF